MRLPRRSIALIGLLALSACVGRFGTAFDETLPADVSLGWTVSDVLVTVPDALVASDANTLVPRADIVWHGEPPGDRKVQVAAILDEGITQGASILAGPRVVRFDVRLERFHGVTPAAMARAPSAVHNIKYKLWVVDVATDSTLMGPFEFSADLEANVGAAAIVAMQSGQSERVRIVDHLAETTRGWLGLGPDPRRKFMGLGR